MEPSSCRRGSASRTDGIFNDRIYGKDSDEEMLDEMDREAAMTIR